MKIALLNIRFEISEDSEFQGNIDYTALSLCSGPGRVGKASYASVVQDQAHEQTQITKEEFGELTIDDFRGDRKLLDIAIETYNQEEFEIEEVEKYISAHPASMSEPLRRSPPPCSSKEETRTKSAAADAAVGQSKKLSTSESEPKNPDKSVSTLAHKPGLVNVQSQGHRENEVATKQKEANIVVRPKSQSPTPLGTASLHFYSGNPTVEKVKGILHIYKDHHQMNQSDDTERSELICMLAVPAKYTIHDLLQFNGPCIRGIEYMRIIRDGSPNQYMVLIKFKTQKLADEYYMSYNNTTFNNIESDVVHLVYVGRVETLKESENASFPVPGMTELPNCPVCLERMDESVDGILTILCNHAFHMECLDKWGDTSCPVCRYCQTPEEVSDNRCMKCGSEESLWICLICGNIGCGRYVGLHAYRHFQETNHTYAMELGNNRVWDYVGDNYVHRLVQNKSDGKLVQVDEGGNPVQDEKLDSLNLEYTYLLTNQLESQRQYFEEKMEDIEKSLVTKIHVVEDDNQMLAEQCSKLQCSLDNAEKEKALSEKKSSTLHSRLKKVLHDLQEEKTMNKCLMDNQAVWQKRVNTLEGQVKEFNAQKEKELNELREQLRDVMFYVEAQQKLQETEGITQAELQEGQVIVGATGTSPQQRHRGRKKPR